MTDPTITDLRRELEKARLALIDAQSHLASHAEMNAALHCATTVMYSPLHAKVTNAIGQIEHALKRTEPAVAAWSADEHSDSHCLWRNLLADLDRCQHGRHVGDACGSCGTSSHGNPHMVVGDVIGYGIYGHQIVMPDRDHKHDLAAWRAQPTEEAQR
ncbi:hypothetical protein [Streptomyces bottropensis]|uniref:hypothetical protein n=1 Tax=Streptomyces bottropensis TaxID=42235 RepID=UPI0036AAF5B6